MRPAGAIKGAPIGEPHQATAALRATLAWYFHRVYGRVEGSGSLPFYCDPSKVGHFAVNTVELADGHPAALFKLFVALAMFQARRDVVIMQQQAAMSLGEVQLLGGTKTLERFALRSRCAHFAAAETFDEGCSVFKSDTNVDCACHPGEPCHVKDATRLLKRMGDMGKLPTSAWLHTWKGGRFTKLLDEVRTCQVDPQHRAALLVERFSNIYRVGEKLATMFVSALSTPALAPGLTPWFPAIDGNNLVVVDTHVARAVDLLRGSRIAATYAARADWIREHARALDLREFDAALPRFSPRVVQQALYSFCSKSNRIAESTGCAPGSADCKACVPTLCPFAAMT